MNATRTKTSEQSDRFLNLVDFKWLMAGVGWRVDLSRLQNDQAYAEECLQRALRSESELLRTRSIELLGIHAPSGHAMPRTQNSGQAPSVRTDLTDKASLTQANARTLAPRVPANQRSRA